MGELNFAPGVILSYVPAVGAGMLLAYLLRQAASSKGPRLIVSLMKEEYGPWRWQAHLRGQEQEEFMASGKIRGHNSAAEAMADARRTFGSQATYDGNLR